MKTKEEKIAQLLIEINKIIAASEKALKRQEATQPPLPANVIPFPTQQGLLHERH